MSQPQAASVAAPVASEPQVPVVSHENILEIEAKAPETYKISVNLCNITSVLNLKDFGKPLEVLTRINEFALRSSDIAVCGESCVSETDSIHVIFQLNHQQRLDDVFFRAMALMEADTGEGVDQRVRAANAVRQARIETRAEHEVRKAMRVTENEKRDMKTYIKAGSSKKRIVGWMGNIYFGTANLILSIPLSGNFCHHAVIVDVWPVVVVLKRRCLLVLTV